MGRSWGTPGTLLGSFCAFVYVFAHFGTYLHAFACFISICVILRLWGALGALLRVLGAPLDALGGFWDCLGGSWDAFGALLGALGTLLGRSWVSSSKKNGKIRKKTEILS